MTRNFPKVVLPVLVYAFAGQAKGAEVVFRDDFSAPQLQSGWTIIRPDVSTNSLTSNPGFFRVLTQRGLLGEEGTARNLLVRPAAGDFLIETRLQFDPRDGQPFAGLLVYQDDAHAIALGLAYASGERGQFRGVIMLNVGDNVDANNRPAAKYDESNSSNPGLIYLRILRQGDQFVGAYSSDGLSYRDIGTVTNALNDQLSVGIGGANGDSENCGPDCDVSIPALFDYFIISTLEGAGPPPSDGTIESVEITGPQEAVGGGSASFQATAHFSDGTSQDVSESASWTVAPTGTGVIEDGVFRPSPSNSDRMATIVVTYEYQSESGPITFTDAVLVRIKAGTTTRSNIRMCGAGLVGMLPCFVFMSALRAHRKSLQKPK